MALDIDAIKSLRQRTGMSMGQCKDALEEAGGDEERAVEALRKTGAAVAAKKASRELGAGVVEAYIHAGGTVGALAELLCETDFVAKNEEFKTLARECAMQVAATDEEVVARGAEALLAESYIKDTSRTVGDLLKDATQKFGERTELGRVARFSI